jgi:hypothetical protein
MRPAVVIVPYLIIHEYIFVNKLSERGSIDGGMLNKANEKKKEEQVQNDMIFYSS